MPSAADELLAPAAAMSLLLFSAMSVLADKSV